MLIEGENMKNLLEVKVEELGFSTRAYNCLRRSGLDTVGDILDFCVGDPSKINEIRKSGAVTQKEIIEGINKFDSRLFIGMTVEEIDAFLKDTLETKEYYLYTYKRKLISNEKTFFSTKLIELGIDANKYFPCCEVETLWDLLVDVARKLYDSEYENELRKIFDELDFDIIYFGMSIDEIEGIIVPDKIIEKLNDKKMKKNTKNEPCEKYPVEKLLDSAETDIKSLRDSIDEKEKLFSRLNELLQEKERLIELNKNLDIKIEDIIGKLKTNYEYRH